MKNCGSNLNLHLGGIKVENETYVDEYFNVNKGMLQMLS